MSDSHPFNPREAGPPIDQLDGDPVMSTPLDVTTHPAFERLGDFNRPAKQAAALLNIAHHDGNLDLPAVRHIVEFSSRHGQSTLVLAQLAEKMMEP